MALHGKNLKLVIVVSCFPSIILLWIFPVPGVRLSGQHLAQQLGWTESHLGNSECKNTSDYVKLCGKSKVYTDLKTALKERASKDKVLLLAGVIDKGYITLAKNFHFTSVVHKHICNVLYILVDNSTIPQAVQYHMPVYLYDRKIIHHDVGVFGTQPFKEKSNIKVKVTHQALMMGYTVLVSDLDIYFRTNPFSLIQCSDRCDMKVQDNRNGYRFQINTGLMYVRATVKSVLFYEKMHSLLPSWKDDDQTLFNHVYNKKYISGANITALPFDVFCTGRVKKPKLVKDCIVYHANFITGISGKVQRLKSLGMWNIDTLDYSCTHT